MLNTILEQRIMKRVKYTFYLKKVFNSIMLKIYALFLTFFGIFSLVSVANVFRNMPSLFEVGSFYRFVSDAVLNTEFTVQLVLGVAVIVGVMLIKDAIKNFSYKAIPTTH